MGEKTAFSINGIGKTGQLHAKELNWITLSHHAQTQKLKMDSAISLSYAAFIVLSSRHSCSSQKRGRLKGFPVAPCPGRKARASFLQVAARLWRGRHCLLGVPRASLSRTQARLQELCHCDPVSAVAPTCPTMLVQQGWG